MIVVVVVGVGVDVNVDAHDHDHDHEDIEGLGAGPTFLLEIGLTSCNVPHVPGDPHEANA